MASMGVVLRDTDHLLSMLSGRVFPANVALTKVDVKSFFMSGPHSLFVDSLAAVGVCRDDVTLLQGIARYLRSNQFLRWRGKALRTTRGSGMGAIASGALSDLLFWWLVEKKWASRCPWFAFYARFKDGIFFLSAPQLTDFCVRGLSSRAAPAYKLLLAERDLRDIPMLDVLLTKRMVTGGCVLTWVPYAKPTSRKVPLTWGSNHHKSTLVNWPTGEVVRLSRRVSSYAWFEEFRSSFVEKMIFYMVGERASRQARDWQCPLASVNGMRNLRTEAARSTSTWSWPEPVPDRRRVRAIRIILPFHPAFCAGLLPLLRQTQSRWGPLTCSAGMPEHTIEIGWQCLGQRLSTIMEAGRFRKPRAG